MDVFGRAAGVWGSRGREFKNLASPTIYSAGPRSGAHQTLGLAALPSEALFPKWETSAIADTVAITTETWVMLGRFKD